MTEPKAKKIKADLKDESLAGQINIKRKELYNDVLEFPFNKKRVRMLSKHDEVPQNTNAILYWMSRDQRVQDNWAFLFAQRLALKFKVPLRVLFCLVPKFLDATIRQYYFMLEGLKEVEEECRKLNVHFDLKYGTAKDIIPDYANANNIGCIVTDFSPLRVPQQWSKDLVKAIDKGISFCQIDAHNVVPCWEASDKQEYGARTIRIKINKKLDEYLTEFPPVIKHPHGTISSQKINWKEAYDSLEVNTSVKKVDWAKPGTEEGFKVLKSFIGQRLKLFADKNNDPTVNALSNLSPWIHFGQISAQRCVLEVKKQKKYFQKSVESFIEQTIIRRELADNYCYYQDNYDNIKGCYDWALKTLDDHRKDKRKYLYSKEQFENGLTHDDLWNSAQFQLVKEGKMHGFLRMYWAKKILEWTESPEEALSISIYLNDKYNLDGRDPNGYVGCMWSICGIHDQGWREREIFGKIRYMNYEGCKRKFDINSFISRYGGKKHPYKPVK